MNLFTPFYYIFSLLLFIVAAPYLIYLSSKKKYRKVIPARFFLWANPRLNASAKGIWFHVCSLGEAISLAPLVQTLAPNDVRVTTITKTGFEEAKKLGEEVRYLPFELWLPFWMRKQKVLVVLEAELWYMLFLVAKAQGTKTVLLNARISDKSYKKYLKMRWFYKRLFRYVDKIFCQSPMDQERLLALGAKDVEVIGNIKLARKILSHKKLPKPEKLMIVGASTHEGEEALILNAFGKTKKGTLVMVPRHPERFETVHKLMSAFAQYEGLSYHRYSQQEDFESDMVLVDTLGELINIYAISDVVILGGAFTPIGGHNPLEPATFNNKIISGKHFFNLKGLFSLVSHIEIIENDDLAKTLDKIDAIEIAQVEGSVDLTPFYHWMEETLKEE